VHDFVSVLEIAKENIEGKEGFWSHALMLWERRRKGRDDMIMKCMD
jgi:hypothetical protein